MGLAASQARWLLLHAWKSDLELRGQQINGRRLMIATQSADAMSIYADALANSEENVNGEAVYDDEGNLVSVGLNNDNDPDNDTTVEMYREDALAAYNLSVANLEVQDKALELELKNIDTQHKAVETEIDAVKKVIDGNIEKSFKTFGA